MSETEARRQKPKVSPRVIVLVVLGGWLILLYLSYLFAIHFVRPAFHRYESKRDMQEIYLEMLVYANENDDKYPTANKWCDLLLEGYRGWVSESTFVYPGNRKERCSYAINPNCEPNSPNDVVLLFETKGGWNQFGGPELVTFKNHKGKGCNILFNDYHVEFVTPEKLAELKWKDEQKQ